MKISGWEKASTKKIKDRWYSPKYGYLWIHKMPGTDKNYWYVRLHDKAKIKAPGFKRKVKGIWFIRFENRDAAKKFAVDWMKKHPII